jgi:DNA-binding CsgD family transcriptional regulator
MAGATLQDAIFRLGMLSADPRGTNHELLRLMAEISASTLGVEMVIVAVHENGVLEPATACWVHGPWSSEECDGLAEHARWSVDERPAASRLAESAPGRLCRRAELVTPEVFRVSRMSREVLDPCGIVDELLIKFRRDLDGAEVVIRFASKSEIPAASMELAERLGPFLADCWARGWRHEPSWMTSLKPNSRRVLELVLEGLDDAQIADRTGLTYHSVRAHLKRLFKDAHVRSRLHLMQTCWSFNGVARDSAIREKLLAAT